MRHFPAAPVLPLLVALLLSGCARTSSPPEAPTPAPTAAEQAEGEDGATRDAAVRSETEALLRQDALDFLDAGDLEAAAESWEAFLAFRGMEPGAEEALWWLAVLHILPDSPIQAPDEGQARLAALAERFPETMEGQQARLIILLMTELEESRRAAQDQAERLEELARTMEELRRIDLNRRPGGGRP
ncbi:MAG: hypothetical protein EA352_10510 [Gemmatimonadales bacterium]|nr:MAG: hypothetical protein EA352_10510 [Gemmatimonadales bacterium]